MAIHIGNINIDRFRGINSLEMNNLNHVNIIAGDNNSGKTSVLEAMLLLRNPKEFNNVLRVVRTRDMGFRFNSTSVYEDFINLFPRNSEPLKISIDAECRGNSIRLCLIGTQKTILLAPEDTFQNYSSYARWERIKQSSGNLETVAFRGEFQYDFAEEHGNDPVEFHTHSRTTGRVIGRNEYLNIVYVSPIDHMRGNTFGKILRDDLYKDICINVLKLFDPQIADIFYLKNENFGRPIEYIKHSVLGNMPLSTYGDGIKRVLSLASGITQAANGVLMIDELETAIHSKYYDEIFRFVLKACKQFQVQLFVTTHSMEAIDELLAAQNYDLHDSDDVSVITFKKDPDDMRTYSRILAGRHVLSNREEFGFEVRL
jgi:energy-coupling factor transporter ATP-binding protein EcfA2